MAPAGAAACCAPADGTAIVIKAANAAAIPDGIWTPMVALLGVLFTAAVRRPVVEPPRRVAPTPGCALPGFPGFFQASPGVNAFRPRQAEVVAQCLALIFGAKQ